MSVKTKLINAAAACRTASASDAEIANQVLAELEELHPMGNFGYEVTRDLLNRKVIDLDMVDMPSGEFGDLIIPALADDEDYKQLKTNALESFREKGGVDERTMLTEFENDVTHGVQDWLVDIADEER